MTNPVVKTVSSAHIVIGKYHFSLKRTRASWRNGWFQNSDKAWTTSVWRTLSYKTARKPSLTTRPGSRQYAKSIFILGSLLQSRQERGQWFPGITAYKFQEKESGFLSWRLTAGAARELCPDPGWEGHGMPPPASTSFTSWTLLHPGASRVAWPFAILWPPEMIKKCVFIRHCCKFAWYILLYKCTLKHETTSNLIN